MKKAISIPVEKVNVKQLVSIIGLAGTASFLPFVFHVQWITGPIINAILILSLLILGVRSAVFIALIPSIMALSGGLLPVILAPVVPFIMLSNIIFIFSIEYFQRYSWSFAKRYWIGVTVGSFLKFLFLLTSVNWIGHILIKQELLIKVAQMMSWPQFVTAMLGGLIAWMFYSGYKLNNIMS